MADGLAKTARVITAAAAIMICVFGSFVIGDPLHVLKVFGLGLAAAILIDATLVRMVLVPAVMELLGRGELVDAVVAGPDRPQPRRGGRRGPARRRPSGGCGDARFPERPAGAGLIRAGDRPDLFPPGDRCSRGVPPAGNVGPMSDRSRKIAKPAAAFGVLATMASIWWFALRPRRKHKGEE